MKAGNSGRNRKKLSYAPLLTPSGIEAKARLIRAFLIRKVDEYDSLNKFESLWAGLGNVHK